jgi:sulfur relay (sulfurtransferase) complex TusBCD TusD component (DsrE family)
LPSFAAAVPQLLRAQIGEQLVGESFEVDHNLRTAFLTPAAYPAEGRQFLESAPRPSPDSTTRLSDDGGSRLFSGPMNVAYVFSTSGHTASYKLGKMILPQLEQRAHGVEVVGMFFFDDNTYALRAGDPVGERLARVAAQHGMLLMLCDQCALERGLAEGEIGRAQPVGTVAGVQVGCFPDLYAALAGNPPDHVITL